MYKIDPRNYKGIKFVTLASLPEDHRELLYEWIDKNSIISIQVKNSILRDCVQYSDYEYWFENILIHNKKASSQEDNSKLKRIIKLALSK